MQIIKIVLLIIFIIGYMDRNQEERLDHQSNSEFEKEPQKEEERATRIEKMLRAVGVPCGKTSACMHKFGCVESILKDSVRISLFSYLIKFALSALFKVKAIFKSPSQLIKLIKNKDSISFGLFVGSFVLIFRTILCLLRRIISDENKKYIPLLAGAIGGLVASLFLQQKTRQSFALFLMARAIDISYHNLVKKGYLPEFKYFYIVMYSVCFAFAGYCYSNEPGCLPSDLNKFYLDFANETIGDMQMRQIWTERKNNQLARLGIPRQDPLQYMPRLRKYYEQLANPKK